MGEKIRLEAMSRRRALFMALAAPLSLTMPATVLLGSDAETAPAAPETVGPTPQTTPQTAPATGTERRQQRRTARKERREERRTARKERRQERRTARKERR